MNKELKAIINKDIYRHFGNSKRPIYWKLSQHMLLCIIVFRKAQYYKTHNKILSLLYLYKLKKLCYKYGFNVPASTTIGAGFFIGHCGQIIINDKAIIGENCNIAPGVTIGVENRGERKGVPEIGNKVWIGTNAVLVGKIKIGNNVLISLNSFVNYDVPDNSIVIGNAKAGGKILSSLNATEGYINNII
jgi:serine O-acetyltransferase